MAMSKEQKTIFKNYMIIGKKQYIKAQEFEAKSQFEQAKNSYYIAMQNFCYAFILAKDNNDFCQEEANREYRLSKAMHENMMKIISRQK